MLSELRNRILLSSRRAAYHSYQERPFDGEYLEINVFVSVLKPFLSIISVATGFVYLADKLKLQTGVESTILAVFTLLTLEGLKYFLTPKMMNRYYKRRYVESLLLAAFVLPLYLTSIFVSVQGISTYFDRAKENTTIIKTETTTLIDELNSDYEESLKIERAKYDAIFNVALQNNTLKWKTTIDQLSKIENRIDNLTLNRDKEVERLRNELQAETTEIKADTTSKVTVVRYISFVTELLLLLGFIFNQYYYYRSYLGSVNFRNRKVQTIKK